MLRLAERPLHLAAQGCENSIPHDLQAEGFVIACRIFDPTIPAPENDLFFRRDCRCLNHVLTEMQQAGQLTEVAGENTIRLMRELEHRGWLHHAGGPGNVTAIFEMVTHVDYLPEYLQRLKDLRFRRRTLEHGETLCLLARDINGDIEAVRDELRKGVSHD